MLRPGDPVTIVDFGEHHGKTGEVCGYTVRLDDIATVVWAHENELAPVYPSPPVSDPVAVALSREDADYWRLVLPNLLGGVEMCLGPRSQRLVDAIREAIKGGG